MPNDLALKDRFRRAHRRDRVAVAMGHLPSAVLAPKDRRDTDRDLRQLVGPADARPDAFDLNRIREVRRDHRRDVLELLVLAIAIVARREIEPGRHLLPAPHRRSEGIRQRDVLTPRPKRLIDLGIAPRDLKPGAAILLHR